MTAATGTVTAVTGAVTAVTFARRPYVRAASRPRMLRPSGRRPIQNGRWLGATATGYPYPRRVRSQDRALAAAGRLVNKVSNSLHRAPRPSPMFATGSGRGAVDAIASLLSIARLRQQLQVRGLAM